MAANTQPIFPLTPKNASVSIANADAQAVKTVYTAGADGGRVSKLSLVSTDTSARDVGIYINGVLVATVAVPIGAGTASGIPAVDVFADPDFKTAYYDASGNPVMDIQGGTVLGINAPVSVTATKAITAMAMAADF